MYLLHLLGRLEIFSILFNSTNLHNFDRFSFSRKHQSITSFLILVYF